MKKLISILCLILAVHTVSVGQTENSKKETESKTLYTCSMHPKVKSPKEGKCSSCGMKLVKGTPVKTVKEKVYICTMCKGVASKKPGTYPKCNMSLILKEEKSALKH